MLTGSSWGCGDHVWGRAVLLHWLWDSSCAVSVFLSFSHTLCERKALVHGITPLPARCSLCTELVLWFTSLSDSSFSDFKGALALLQPLATQGEQSPAWKRCSMGVWQGCAASFQHWVSVGIVSAFLLEWLLLVHRGWVIMDLWLVPPGTFTPVSCRSKTLLLSLTT